MEYTDIKSKHSKTVYRALTVSGISFVSAILGVFFLPPILSPIAMIISHLSKGRLKARHFAAQAATVVAIIAFILNGAMIGFSVYRLKTDPEARARLSTMLESAYGITLDEYTEMVTEEFKVLIPSVSPDSQSQ